MHRKGQCSVLDCLQDILKVGTIEQFSGVQVYSF